MLTLKPAIQRCSPSAAPPAPTVPSLHVLGQFGKFNLHVRPTVGASASVRIPITSIRVPTLSFII
eukprot:3444574-Rhodomonas_salina.2